MNTIQFGPLAIAAERLLAVAALWAFVAVVSYGRRWTDGEPVRPTLIAMTVGIVAARAGFVAENWPAFSVEPWAAAYLWQGGFSPAFGLAGAVLALFVMLRGKRLALALAALVGVGATWAVADGLIQPAPKSLPMSLTAKRLDGKSISLDSLHGRPFVINLWATWCGPCRREMPMLAQVAAANPDVPVLLINQGEDAQRVRAFLREEGLASSNILRDAHGVVRQALGSSALPTTAFVSADGVVIELHVGEISRAALMASISDLRRSGAK
jgi:cytochrome c biogenesis protein CcmG, thiol:disulfide interchange protein DsbE